MKGYEPQNLIHFINKQLPNNELTLWRVMLMSKSKAASVEFEIAGNQIKIGQWKRTQDHFNSNDKIYHIRKSHIIDPNDEFLDLSQEEYDTAMELTREYRERQKIKDEPKYPNGKIVRDEIRDKRKPLLLIYLLDPKKSETKMPDKTNPFVGYAISFPNSNFNAFVSYAVNEELLDRFNVEDTFEDDEDDEENEN